MRSIKKALDSSNEAEFDSILIILDGYCRYKDPAINYKLVLPKKYIDIILNWGNAVKFNKEKNILYYKGHEIEIKE